MHTLKAPVGHFWAVGVLIGGTLAPAFAADPELFTSFGWIDGGARGVLARVAAAEAGLTTWTGEHALAEIDGGKCGMQTGFFAAVAFPKRR